MRAMILAAGLGTRLMPLTRLRAKCLMPIMNRPLLDLWLEQLSKAGAEAVVVNTHHLASMVEDHLAADPPQGCEVIISREPEILGTGGGLVQAREHLGAESFVLVNADVVAAIDLPALYQCHLASGALATLYVHDDPRFNTVAVDPAGRVVGFKGDAIGESDVAWLTYCGIAVLSPELLGFLPSTGKSSLIDAFRQALAAGGQIDAMPLTGFWDDMGQPGALLGLHLRLASDPPPGLEHLAPGKSLVLGKGARVSESAQVSGLVVLGPGAEIQDNARVSNSLLLDHARVAAGARVRDAVLGDGFFAQGEIRGGAHA